MNGGSRTEMDDGRTGSWWNQSGHDDRHRSYKAGQQLYCKVLSKVNETPEGYFVTVVKTGEIGFLQTKEVLTAGAEIFPTFLCWTPGKLLASYFFRGEPKSD